MHHKLSQQIKAEREEQEKEKAHTVQRDLWDWQILIPAVWLSCLTTIPCEWNGISKYVKTIY